jgi:hypothetical protein
MESPSHAVTRLLQALETLVEQEAVQIASGDHCGVLRTQRRATPVVERLAQIGARAADPAAHARIAVLLERRQRSQERLAAQIGRIREELSRTAASQHRLARIAPVYISGTGRCVPRRLSAVS